MVEADELAVLEGVSNESRAVASLTRSSNAAGEVSSATASNRTDGPPPVMRFDPRSVGCYTADLRCNQFEDGFLLCDSSSQVFQKVGADAVGDQNAQLRGCAQRCGGPAAGCRSRRAKSSLCVSDTVSIICPHHVKGCAAAASWPAPRVRLNQLLMAMRLTCDCAFSVFGKVTVSTPFLNVASTWSSLTSTPSGMRRSKRP